MISNSWFSWPSKYWDYRRVSAYLDQGKIYWTFFCLFRRKWAKVFLFLFCCCSFLYLKFSLASLACEICKPHTTAINHFIGFLSKFCSKLTSTLLGLYSSQHKEPPPTWHIQAHYNCMLAYKGVLWHLFKALKGLWILHVMLLWMRAIFSTSNKAVLTSSSCAFLSHTDGELFMK